MKFSTKLSLIILITGMTILVLLSLAVYGINSNMVLKSGFKHSKYHADEISFHFNRFLYEKAKRGFLPIAPKSTVGIRINEVS